MMLPALYPILDASLLPPGRMAREEALRALVLELLAAGVTFLQYRNKRGGEAEVLADALWLRALAPSSDCVLILNDFPALAVRAAFDGVHVGQEDMAAGDARAIIGPGAVLGLSTHNAEQLAAAGTSPADYLAVGPVFSTATKMNPDPVVGIEGVRRARGLTKKPLVAIGGITIENCREVLNAGADSVAVISALFADPAGRAPAKIARDFFSKLR